jgi:FkbM family methyltransferase
MTAKKRLLFTLIKIQRYIFNTKFITIYAGPLKGYKWSSIYNYEYLTGDYEDKETLKIFCSWLKEDTVLYDLGANVGYYAFIANQFIHQGKIYSFEPLPANIETFNAHLQLNKNRLPRTNITLLPYAVSDEEKEVVFSNNSKTIEGNTYIDSVLHATSSRDLLVKCFSIDGLVQQGYQVPHVLKIDVEGAEYDVLRGAENTIKKFRPNILLATHDCHLPGVQQQCLDLLIGLGYELTKLNCHNKSMPGLDDYIAIHKKNT